MFFLEPDLTFKSYLQLKEMQLFYILTHIFGKQILHTYLTRCLFLFLQAFSPTRLRLQILHRRPFKGLWPHFLMNTIFHGMLSNSIQPLSWCVRYGFPQLNHFRLLGGKIARFEERERRNLEKARFGEVLSCFGLFTSFSPFLHAIEVQRLC